MKQGLLKNSAYIFTFLIAFALVLSPEEEAKALEIKYDSNMFCVDNAVAPLNNLLDIQTFLSCNGFNPGPIDGLSGSRTNNAIISVPVLPSTGFPGAQFRNIGEIKNQGIEFGANIPAVPFPQATTTLSLFLILFFIKLFMYISLKFLISL